MQERLGVSRRDKPDVVTNVRYVWSCFACADSILSVLLLRIIRYDQHIRGISPPTAALPKPQRPAKRRGGRSPDAPS